MVGTFSPITSPSAGADVYMMAHCVSGFRDYVSEGGTDTYPIFWKRFSSSKNTRRNSAEYSLLV